MGVLTTAEINAGLIGGRDVGSVGKVPDAGTKPGMVGEYGEPRPPELESLGWRAGFTEQAFAGEAGIDRGGDFAVGECELQKHGLCEDCGGCYRSTAQCRRFETPGRPQ